MKNYMGSIIVGLFFTSANLYAGGYIPKASNILCDFSDKLIVRDDVLSCFDEDEPQEDGFISCSSVKDSLNAKLSELTSESSEKYIINYDSASMNDITFKELTDKILPLIQDKTQKNTSLILNFSNNRLTMESLPSLMKFLERDEVDLINIVGNSKIDKRNVADVFHKMEESFTDEIAAQEKRKKVRDYSKKLVFLPKNYINTAKKRVKIYNTLQKDGYLLDSWDETHKDFYKTLKSDPSLEFEEEASLFKSDEDDLLNPKL